MRVEQRAIAEIKPYANNPRINDPAVDAVARSIAEFGFRQPIVIDEQGVIVVGHTRYKAAQKMGLEKVPVHVATDLSPEKARAYRIADNQTASIAQWNYELLPIELGELELLDFDLAAIGFSDEDLARIRSFGQDVKEGLTDPDDVPEPPDDPVTKPGDLYVLGNHRLLCADSGKTEDVDRLLDGAQIHLANCDPPYGVRVEPRSNNAIAAGKSSFTQAKKKDGKHQQSFDLARHPEKGKRTSKKMRAKDRPLVGDWVDDAAFGEMLLAWFGQIARVLLPGRAFYIWGGYANLGNYPLALKASGLYFSQGVVWDKQHPVLTRKDFMGAFEIAFYGWREGGAHQFFGPNNATDLWPIKKVNPQSMVHLTEKPVSLAAKAIQYSSQPGENVLDLFGGSGSTLIGCEQTDRHAYLMEIDPAYCDVIVQRWEAFAGKKAERIPAEKADA